MAKAPKKEDQKVPGHVPVPFDDALRKILSAPPQHKPAKKNEKKKNG
jgi:hypothetical protein